MERGYCGDAEHPLADASGELSCGDFLSLIKHDVPEALEHWQHSYGLATTREQQCRAVSRIVQHSLTPEKDLVNASPVVVADCREREAERRQRQVLQGQRDLDESICRTAHAVCQSEGLRGALSPACQALPAECH